MEVKTEILEAFHLKLTRSGYSREQVRQVVEAGISGFHNKYRRGLVHRQIGEIQGDREIRKILEQSTWYLPKPRQEGEETHTQGSGFGAGRGRKYRAPNPRNPYAPKAPLFIPRTNNGALIERLRRVEEGLTKRGTKSSKSSIPKIKLVEQAGVKIKSILTDEDPWSSRPCSHPQCTTCEGENPGDCRVRSVVYNNTCLKCKEEGRVTKYVGETARTMRERSVEHQADALNHKQTSHMRDHVVDSHPNSLSEVLSVFRMGILKAASSPSRGKFERL